LLELDHVQRRQPERMQLEQESVPIPIRYVFTVIYTQTSERGVGVSLGAQLRARLIGAMEYVEQVLE